MPDVSDMIVRLRLRLRLRRRDSIRGIDPVRWIAYELGRGRAIENTRRELEATRLAMGRVEALARRVPPTAGESSPGLSRSA
jgi:hypothetical protein